MPPLRAARRLSVLSLVVATFATVLVSAASPAAAGPEVRRLAGADRFSTAVTISRASHPTGAPVAVLTTGASFPDALAGGPAAAKLRGPVLLVGKDKVPPVVLEELRRLKPQRVLLLGGTGAVSDTPVAQIRQEGLAVERLAGTGRYDTAALVSQRAFAAGVEVAYVATGLDYPDALAGAAAASRVGAPVLLVGRDDVPPATAGELARLQPQRIVVLGGSGAVSTRVETELRAYAPNVARIAGPDRYATAAAVARATPGTPRAVYLATGQGFADALAGGPAAGAAQAPVLLVRPTCIPGPVHVEMERHGFPPVTLLGGSAALGLGVAELRPCFRVPDGEIAPGVVLSTIADPRGPWSGKVVSVAPSAVWRLDTVLAQEALPGLETTSSIARRTGALVAVNGDFALAGGRPAHAFAKDGRLLQTPQVLGRNVAVEARSGIPHLGFPTVDVSLLLPERGASAPITKVNSGPAGSDAVALTTREGATAAPEPATSCAARVQPSGPPTLDVTGRAGQSYDVVSVRCDGTSPPGAGDLLSAPRTGRWAPLVQSLLVGEPVQVSWSLGWRDVLDAIGGNPTLLEGGRVMEGNVSGTDAFSARNPRTAVGYRPDGTVLLVTVDGRGADGSVGMSLRELAQLFVRLGASDALNLDGGGSTTMVIGREVQNSPSDGPERAVSSALVLKAGSRPSSAFSTSSSRPVPLTPQEQAAADERASADPGSTGGLTAHLGR